MNHPNREEWISFLYEDIDAGEKSRLSEHLKSCAACHGQLQTWRGTMNALDAYQVPRRARRKFGAIRWAAAAAVLLAAGIAIGSRAGAEPSSVADLRQRLEKAETQNARTQQLLVDLSETIAANRAVDQAALVATARALESTRKDLETVAALTEVNFKNAENQLVRLASYTGAPR